MENDRMTEQRYRELCDDFMGQMKRKDKIQAGLNKLNIHLFKGVATGYGIFRLLDDFCDHMEMTGALSFIKRLIEMGRSQMSDVIERVIDTNDEDVIVEVDLSQMV